MSGSHTAPQLSWGCTLRGALFCSGACALKCLLPQLGRSAGGGSTGAAGAQGPPAQHTAQPGLTRCSHGPLGPRADSAPCAVSPISAAVPRFLGLCHGGNIFILTAGDLGGLYIWEDTNLWSKYFILVLSSERDFYFPLNICEILLGHFRVPHIWDLERRFLLRQ